MSIARRYRRVSLLVVCFAAAIPVGCGGGGQPTVVPDQQADTYLFTQGSQALERRRWVSAREYFRRLVETYPTSPHRQDAKLGIGDSYLGERRVESDILAVAEFKEFLRFYPLSPRADYAQYRLAFGQFQQILSPERDQTATLDTLRELRTFISTYPNSRYMKDVLDLERKTRDRLSESEFLVGRHYYRSRWYTGAVTRLEAVLKEDPQFTGRDGVYFFLAEAYAKQNRTAEARAYYQKVLDEFRVSEFRDDATKRLAAPPPPAVADSKPAPPAATPPPATAAQPAADPSPATPPASTSTPR
jgi:outer membrane protein assembly factor BamD